MTSDLLTSALWLGTFLTITVFGVYSTILLWHWKKYGSGKWTTAANATLYLTVGLTLLLVMVASAISFTVL